MKRKATQEEYETAVGIYQDRGQYAVFEYANSIGISDEFMTRCAACECATPSTEDEACLVCGSSKVAEGRPVEHLLSWLQDNIDLGEYHPHFDNDGLVTSEQVLPELETLLGNLRRLAEANCEATLCDGIVTLEDGTRIELLGRKRNPDQLELFGEVVG